MKKLIVEQGLAPAMQKALSIILSVVMLLSMTAGVDLSAYAQTSGDFEYELLDDGTAEITGYTGSATGLEIPSTLDGYIVTRIGDAFMGCSSLISVTIPNSVTSIGDFAFWQASLTSITIPDSVISIGDHAFHKSYNLTSITIPNSVTSIGDYAFFNCVSLTSVTISNSVTSIGECAFYECSSLTNVTIGNSTTSIGDHAFAYCSSLTSITIPDSVISIGNSAFIGCSGLTSITIPNGVTSIDYHAFEYCESLTGIWINNLNCSIYDSDDTISDSAVIYGYKNSTAQAYAEKYNRTFVAIDTEQEHIHTWNSGVVTKAATCTAEGVRTYTCVDCNATVTEAIAKTAHTPVSAVSARATASKDGKIATTCSVCGTTLSTAVIPKASNIKLSKTSYTYNGKVQKPGVVVKDSKGKTLKNGTDYTVSYAKDRKNVGKYAVKVTFKGKYSGSKTLYFTINPKATTISSVTAKSKGFTVKWKKQTSQTTGYQMQYSTDKNFKKNNKTVTVTKNKTTSKTISKLKGKKKYYVRIRTYKTVNGQKYYSAWSKAKTVTTKK